MEQRPGRPLTVLVTGVGAPVGVSILKALRQSAERPRIVATDANPMSVGLYRADRGRVLPNAAGDEDRYVEALTDLCLAEDVSMICFGSEMEIRRIAPHRAEVERRTGARLIVNAPGLVERFADKFATAEALRERGLAAPDTVLVADPVAVRSLVERHGFPLVLKPRHGSGSKGVYVVGDEEEVRFLARRVNDAVLQEYLQPEDEEYTVGVYKSPTTGYVGQIAFRRTLSAGLTYRAEVVRDPVIESTCRAIVEAFDVWGPVNLQLRRTESGVKVFEINLRFSSSAVMRAWFGFNEPELCLRDVVRGERLAEPVIRPGYAMRYWNEIYLEPGEYPMAASADPFAYRRSGRLADDF